MNDRWIRDTGLVFALLFLFVGVKVSEYFLAASAGILIALLFAPTVLKPLAWVWLKVAELLGRIMNPVFFGLVFFFIITPVSILRRLTSEDRRDRKKQDALKSAFVDARGTYTKKLFTQPF